jgi:TolA-binding protein
MNEKISCRKNWSALGGAVMMSILLQACAIASSPSVEQKPNPVVDQSAKLRELRKQIRERDRRIEELESQLEALKLIDQDSVKQKTPLKPPATLEPLE